MCPSSGLWGGLGLWFQVYHPESTIIRRGPALTLCECVFLSTFPYTCTLCPMFSLDPSVVGLANPWTCWRKDTITRLWQCALRIPVSHDLQRVCLSFLLVYPAFWAWCRSRFQQPIRGYPPQGQSAQIPITKIFLSSFSPCRLTSCQTWVNSLADTLQCHLQGNTRLETSPC